MFVTALVILVTLILILKEIMKSICFIICITISNCFLGQLPNSNKHF
jgi:hypothetical protein